MVQLIQPDSRTPSQPGYVYHATNVENLHSIIESGALATHRPDYGTDQDTWPDGSTEKRSYWNRNASVVWAFAPEESPAVILRTRETSRFRQERTTGDTYTREKIAASELEVLTVDGWIALDSLQRD